MICSTVRIAHLDPPWLFWGFLLFPTFLTGSFPPLRLVPEGGALELGLDGELSELGELAGEEGGLDGVFGEVGELEGLVVSTFGIDSLVVIVSACGIFCGGLVTDVLVTAWSSCLLSFFMA